MSIGYQEIVKTIVFDIIDTYDDGLVYRLEVMKSNEGFRGQLFRLDTFRLSCSFVDSQPDESFYVLDSHSHRIDLDDKLFDTPQACIDFVANALGDNFS